MKTTTVKHKPLPTNHLQHMRAAKGEHAYSIKHLLSIIYSLRLNMLFKLITFVGL